MAPKQHKTKNSVDRGLRKAIPILWLVANTHTLGPHLHVVKHGAASCPHRCCSLQCGKARPKWGVLAGGAVTHWNESMLSMLHGPFHGHGDAC